MDLLILCTSEMSIDGFRGSRAIEMSGRVGLNSEENEGSGTTGKALKFPPDPRKLNGEKT